VTWRILTGIPSITLCPLSTAWALDQEVGMVEWGGGGTGGGGEESGGED
jgi:hypothetical protein